MKWAVLACVLWGCAAPDNEVAAGLLPGVAVGEAVGFSAFPDNGDSKNWQYTWTQVAGPEVDIADPRGPVAAFDVPEPGLYRLDVDAVSAEGERLSQSMAFYASGHTPFAARRDRASREHTRVSLRAHGADDVTWTQVEGPSPEDLEEDGPLLTFTAPEVDRDTALVFEASAGGETDTVTVWVTDALEVPAGSLLGPSVRRAPYWPDSPWAESLSCVSDPQLLEACRIEELPLIGQTTSDPTIEHILERTVVSHPWMGEQFERFLTEHDRYGDFRALFASVSAVVISSDVRPSHFRVRTGAIYLDPEVFWTEAWHRDTINEDADYRSDFSDGLQFLQLWRLVEQGRGVPYERDPTVRRTRELEEAAPWISRLLYHELAHANDFFPRSGHATLDYDRFLDVWDASFENGNGPISYELWVDQPLSSWEMFGLADVQFLGAEPTEAELSYTPQDVAGFFFPDDALVNYSYSSPAEDLAMLFEATMMRQRMNIDYDVAVTTRGASAETVHIARGQRGRVGKPALRPRIEFIMDRMAPEWTEFASDLPSPTPLEQDAAWGDTVLPAVEGDPAARSAARGGALLFGPVHPPRTLPRSRR